MKTRDIPKILELGFKAVILFGLLFVSVSCCDDRGRDGRPGRAYLALDWEIDIPNYLNTGSPDIPATFEWRRSYRAYPGWYDLYYEGTYFNGSGNVSYAWDMEYEIWETNGERGSYSYDGEDGPDTYFNLLISPYGPLINTYVDQKCAGTNEIEILSNTGDTIEIMIKGESHNLRAVYRKVEPRH